MNCIGCSVGGAEYYEQCRTRYGAEINADMTLEEKSLAFEESKRRDRINVILNAWAHQRGGYVP